MKKSLSIMLIIMVLMSMLCLSSFAASTSLDASPASANVGDVVTVSVNVSDGLSGARLALEYDTTYFQLVPNSVKEGTRFTVSVNDKTAGKLVAAAVAMTEQPACTVFTANFKVLKTGGKMTLKVLEAIDGNDNDITTSVTGTIMTINQSTGAVTQETVTSAPAQDSGISATKPSKPSGSSNQTAKTTKPAQSNQKGDVTLAPPPPDEPLPDDIMPLDDDVDVAVDEAQKDNKTTVIIAVAVAFIVLAIAVIVALLLKKKNQSENDENLSVEQ